MLNSITEIGRKRIVLAPSEVNSPWSNRQG
jgi:hypothetical protein